MNYDPRDWYWIVGGDETLVYASMRAAFVPADDAAYVAWLKDGNTPTRIASLDELKDVLRAAGVPPFHKVSTYRVLRRPDRRGRGGAQRQSRAVAAVLYGRRDQRRRRGLARLPRRDRRGR